MSVFILMSRRHRGANSILGILNVVWFAMFAVPLGRGAEDIFAATEQRTEGYAKMAEGFGISPVWSSENALSFSRDGKRWRWNPSTQMVTEEVAGEAIVDEAVPRRSASGGAQMALVIENAMDVTLEVFWLDRTGERQSYGRVEKGSTWTQSTYAAHVWVVVDPAAKKDVIAFSASPAMSLLIIREPKEIRWKQRRREGGAVHQEGPLTSDRSPDGKVTVFVKDHNIFLRTEDGNENQVTTDGTALDGYESPFFWSPNGQHLVVMRHRSVIERKVTIVRSSPKDQLQPVVETHDYAKPGDALPYIRPRMIDVVAKKMLPFDESLYMNPWSIDSFHWDAASRDFHFLYNERGHQLLRIVAMDAATGIARALFDEKAETFVDYSQKTWLYWLDKTNQFLWASERDGWNHLYLVDALTGVIKNQITRGEWVLREVIRVDAEQGRLWLKVMGYHAGQDPYYMHFARVNFDGTGFTILTESDGTHEAVFSPDQKWLVASWSRMDHAPVHELRNAEDGKLLQILQANSVTALQSKGWKKPQRFSAKGRDGVTDIYGLIVWPHDFEAGKKYPVIEYIYAGPHNFFVAKEFTVALRLQGMADLGFIFVLIDGMGTNWRSRKFHDVAWHNIGDAGFPDRIAWIKAAAAMHSEMDLTRVGIYGGSAGGQNAMRALIDHGDFYHAAVADCGCHDNRMDKIWWNEAWMGWPIGPHYEESSNVVHAHRLKGNLLLTVGEMDHNVDPASTMQVVNALIKADKDFDFIIVPNADHGAGESPWAARQRARFFQHHLLQKM